MGGWGTPFYLSPSQAENCYSSIGAHGPETLVLCLSITPHNHPRRWKRRGACEHKYLCISVFIAGDPLCRPRGCRRRIRSAFPERHSRATNADCLRNRHPLPDVPCTWTVYCFLDYRALSASTICDSRLAFHSGNSALFRKPLWAVAGWMAMAGARHATGGCRLHCRMGAFRMECVEISVSRTIMVVI
jgi:hypothetical protein